MKDLQGIVVVSLEQAVAAPYASGRLADAGARVIKVEKPEGDFARSYDKLAKGHSAYFVWLNRGKESIVLDLKSTNDCTLLRKIISKTDVLIQNLAPGAMGRLGFALDELRRQNPSLITCSISGYGEDGPRKDQKAYDLLIQAESGLSAINGTEHGPARVGVSVCDIAAGMAAHAAILQALFARERSGCEHGKGRSIAVSLYHSMADWMNVPMMQHRYGGKTPGRLGLKHPTIAPYGVFTCGDGKPLLISIQNEQEWQRLCSEFGQPELPQREGYRDNTQRVANRIGVDGFVSQVFAEARREAVIEKLKTAKIAFGRLSDLDDLVSHPQNQWVTVEAEGQEIEILSPAAIVDGHTPSFGGVPALDAHGEKIRSEFQKN